MVGSFEDFKATLKLRSVFPFESMPDVRFASFVAAALGIGTLALHGAMRWTLDVAPRYSGASPEYLLRDLDSWWFPGTFTWGQNGRLRWHFRPIQPHHQIDCVVRGR